MSDSHLEDNDKIFGIIRRSSPSNTKNIDHIKNDIELIEGDLCDDISINKIIKQVKPHIVYNFAGQSHVQTSFEQPLYTNDVNYFGVIRLLEAIRNSGYNSKFYQAGSCLPAGTKILIRKYITRIRLGILS